jgi:hypothetical protein
MGNITPSQRSFGVGLRISQFDLDYARPLATLWGELQADVSMTSLTPYFPVVQAKPHPDSLGDKAGKYPASASCRSE